MKHTTREIKGCVYRIESPHFVCGIIVNDGYVTDSAPITGYMMGWTEQKMLGYVNQRGFKVTKIETHHHIQDDVYSK